MITNPPRNIIGTTTTCALIVIHIIKNGKILSNIINSVHGRKCATPIIAEFMIVAEILFSNLLCIGNT